MFLKSYLMYITTQIINSFGIIVLTLYLASEEKHKEYEFFFISSIVTVYLARLIVERWQTVYFS